MTNSTKHLLHNLSAATKVLLEPADLDIYDHLIVGTAAQTFGKITYDRFTLQPVYRIEAPSPEEWEVLEPRQREYMTKTREGRLVMPTRIGAGRLFASAQSLDSLAAIPEKAVHPKTGVMLYGMTDTTVLIVNAKWSSAKLIFDNEAARAAWLRIELQLELQAAAARLQGDFKISKQPLTPSYFADKGGWELKPYQKAAIAFLQVNQTGGLFMQQGTGKTATVIGFLSAAARQMAAEQDKPLCVLIVCPPAVTYNWKNEIGRFATVGTKVQLLRGTHNVRIQRLAEAMNPASEVILHVGICSYDTVPRDLESLALFAFDYVIADESQAIMNTTTKRAQTMRALRATCGGAIPLTGTPIGNNMMGLHGQLDFIRPAASGFQAFTAFRTFHNQYDQAASDSTDPVERLIALRGVPLLQERLAGLAFTITKEEAGLDLPERTFTTLSVEMTAKQAQVYKEVRDELVYTLSQTVGTENPITIDNALVMMVRLAQVCSGHFTDDAGVVHDIFEHASQDPKIQALLSLVETFHATEKAVIWTVFKHDRARVSAQLLAAGHKVVEYHGSMNLEAKERAVTAFNNDPETRFIVVNIKSGQAGLNLLGYDVTKPDEYKTDATQTVYYSRNFSAIGRQQSRDRQHRIGTRRPIRVTDLLIADSIDEQMYEAGEAGTAMNMGLQDLGFVLNKVLGLDMSNLRGTRT